MTRTLFFVLLQDASTDAGSSSAPPAVDMSALARVNEDGARTITYLRAHLADLEQKLKRVQDIADVATSKQKLVTEQEDYLIEELGKTAKDLLCKWKPPSHIFDASSSHESLLCNQFCALVGIEPHANTKRQ